MAFTRTGAFEYLSRAHQNGRLGHAYLISGPPGSGKRGLASDLSNLVTSGTASDVFASQPPGVYLAEPESKSRRIVIDQVRKLERALQMRSSGGRRKVAIVAEADRLQPQAANAFLKTLEEPPNDSLLILLSSMPEVLPDTILSRCVAVPLAAEEKAAPSVEEQELVELLGTVANPEAKGVQHAYRLARGFHRLLAQMREAIQAENAAALKRDEARYKNTTDGVLARRARRLFQGTNGKPVRAPALPPSRSAFSLVVGRPSRQHKCGAPGTAFRERSDASARAKTVDRGNPAAHSASRRIA